MVHPSHDAAAGPQLDGYIPLGPPSDVITLYEGPLQLRVGDDLARQRPGEITLVLRSGSHLVWGVDLDGASYEERLQWQFREGSGVPMLRFAFHGTPLELETYLTGDGYGFFGHRTSNADDKTELASVVSHWVNLPHLPHGSRLCHEHDDGSWVEWGGRWMLTLGDWDVTVDERRDLGETLRTATRERLYAISHVMRVRRSDGRTFHAGDARTLLSGLQVALSFALGRWTAPVLPVGLDESGALAWSEWAPLNIDSPAKAHGRWWVEHRPDDLKDYLSCFINNWLDPERQHSLGFLAISAIAAGESGFVEQRVMTALAALEHLSWLAEVRSGTQSETEWRRRKPAWRIRHLVTGACASPEVDSAPQPILASFARTVAHGDGPAALVELRDSITHPKEADERYRVPGLLAEASRLATRYLELALLRWLDYAGHMADRTITTGWAGESRAVPWAPSDGLPR